MDNQQLTIGGSSAFKKPLLCETTFPVPFLPNMGITPEVMQVINSQNILIMRLLEQQNALYQRLSTSKSSGSDSGSNQADKKKMEFKTSAGYKVIHQVKLSSSSNPQENQQFKIPINIIQKQPSLRKKYHFQQSRHFEDQSEYPSDEELKQSEDHFQKGTEKKKQTETKNMVKNFSKAIFNFIRKHKHTIQTILKELGLNQRDFMKKVEHIKGHVHSIAQLRALWIPEKNEYHKAFRIISNIYLRRHCMEKTFNSRIQNYQIHLKYRQRLLETLTNPEDFTVLKIN